MTAKKNSSPIKDNRINFQVGDVTFYVDQLAGFNNSFHQLKLSANVKNQEEKDIEVFDIKNVGNNVHISPQNKRITRIPIGEPQPKLPLEVKTEIVDEIDLDDTDSK